MIKRITFLQGLITCAITVLSFSSKAQTGAQAVSQIMQGIYRNYDSIPYLSFDVKFTYGSDTLLGKYDAEEMDGTFTLAGKKTKYRLGDVDFMQNDSFFIAVYNKDKLIVVDEPKMINSGSQLPMRQQMDSLLQAYSEHYIITTDSIGADTGVINLAGADSAAQFENFQILYDSRSNMLQRVSYQYSEPEYADSLGTDSTGSAPPVTPPVMRKKNFVIQFFNYRYDNYDDAAYDENNYIYFENNVCKPAAKYDDFKIYYSKPSTNYIPEDPKE